jgi:hypothetical protein
MGGQAIENKQFRELADFAPPNDFNNLQPLHETLHFASAKCFLSLSPFFRFVAAQKCRGREIDGGFRARVSEVARLSDSEMAPQVLGTAQNGLRNGAAGSQSLGKANRSGELRITPTSRRSDAGPRHAP